MRQKVNGRAKGAAFELSVAKAFAQTFGLSIRRTPLSGGWSHDNPDVRGDLVCTTPNANWPYCVECKCSEGWRLESLLSLDNATKWFKDWWKQAVDEAGLYRYPILVFSRNRAPVLAVMFYDQIAGMLEFSLMEKLPRSPCIWLWDYDHQRALIIMNLSDLLCVLAPH